MLYRLVFCASVFVSMVSLANASDDFVKISKDSNRAYYFRSDTLKQNGNIISGWYQFEIFHSVNPNYDIGMVRFEVDCSAHTIKDLQNIGFKGTNKQGMPFPMKTLGETRSPESGTIDSIILTMLCRH